MVDVVSVWSVAEKVYKEIVQDPSRLKERFDSIAGELERAEIAVYVQIMAEGGKRKEIARAVEPYAANFSKLKSVQRV